MLESWIHVLHWVSGFPPLSRSIMYKRYNRVMLNKHCTYFVKVFFYFRTFVLCQLGEIRANGSHVSHNSFNSRSMQTYQTRTKLPLTSVAVPPSNGDQHTSLSDEPGPLHRNWQWTVDYITYCLLLDSNNVINVGVSSVCHLDMTLADE